MRGARSVSEGTSPAVSSTVCGSVRPAAGLAGMGAEGEQGVGAGDERAVVEAEVAAAFVVVESELALELAVVELDRPAHACKPGKPAVSEARPRSDSRERNRWGRPLSGATRRTSHSCHGG